MFKRLSFVTGLDRSYLRSIYQFTKKVDDKYGLYRIISYAGKSYPKKPGTIRAHWEFRLASHMEIKKSASASHLILIRLLEKLEIGL